MSVVLPGAASWGTATGLDVRYEVLRLDRLSQIDPREVAFDEVARCAVCGAGDLLDVARLQSSLVAAWCDRCGHLFHRRRPSQSWYLQWYGSSWDTAGAARGTTLRGRLGALRQRVLGGVGRGPQVDVYDFCRPVARPGMRVLDIGCGYGEDLAAFRRAGGQTFGIEASPHRAAAARALGARVATVSVEEIGTATFGTTFDMVISNHVLEHIVDPHQFVQRIAGVLEPGGFVCVTVPNLAEDCLLQQLFFALHVHGYTRSSLETLLVRHGFRTWRVLEEHQVRILAQYRPGGADDALRPRPPRLDADVVLERCLGPGYLRRERAEVVCSWTTLPKRSRTRQLYDVQFFSAAPPDDVAAVKRRSVRLAWSGTPSLPLTFRSAAPDGSAPFWVK